LTAAPFHNSLCRQELIRDTKHRAERPGEERNKDDNGDLRPKRRTTVSPSAETSGKEQEDDTADSVAKKHDQGTCPGNGKTAAGPALFS
jgi:hypothetical protein